MPTAIVDELSKLPISRQRRYQLRKRRQGRCIRCGRQSVNDGCFCETHRQLNNVAFRESQRRRFGLKSRYYEAESYRFFGSSPRGKQLLEAAQSYLQAGRNSGPTQSAAYLHASLMAGFCALEAFTDSIAEGLHKRSLLTARDQSILKVRAIQPINGRYRLSEVPAVEQRVEHLLGNFAQVPFDEQADYWQEFKQAVELRERLRARRPQLNITAAERALKAILILVDTVCDGVYRAAAR